MKYRAEDGLGRQFGLWGDRDYVQRMCDDVNRYWRDKSKHWKVIEVDDDWSPDGQADVTRHSVEVKP